MAIENKYQSFKNNFKNIIKWLLPASFSFLSSSFCIATSLVFFFEKLWIPATLFLLIPIFLFFPEKVLKTILIFLRVQEQCDFVKSKIKKFEKPLIYSIGTFLVLVFLFLAITIWISFVIFIKEKVFLEKFNPEEILNKLSKSEIAIKDTVVSIDRSIEALTSSREKIDSVITQAYTSKDNFLKQIDVISEAQRTTANLNYELEENRRKLSEIEKIVAGERILTFNDFQKTRKKDIIFAFFYGVIATIVGDFLINLFKRLKKINK